MSPLMSTSKRVSLLAAALCVTASCSLPSAQQDAEVSIANWPSAAGPNHNWQLTSETSTPTSWSVSRNENIIWQTDLPNAGQSGISVWQDKLFLTTFAPREGYQSEPKQRLSGKIQGHCVDKHTGKILWTVELEGAVKSPIMYAFSDATSPSPVTDGERVIFTNASGEMAAFDYGGKVLWRRQFSPWTPQDKFPFNKQHEPIIYGDVVLHVEPLDNPRAAANKAYFGWNFLRAINKYTGKTEWIAKEASTTYTTSVMGFTQDGEAAVLTGRGGPHGVPEKPIGISLIRLEGQQAGDTIWRFSGNTDRQGKALETAGSVGYPTWQALFNMHWDSQSTYLFKGTPMEAVVEINTQTGELMREYPLSQAVDYRPWDPVKQQHQWFSNVNLHEIKDWSPRTQKMTNNKRAQHFLKGHDLNDLGMYVFPAWHSNIKVGDYLYFLTGTSHFRNKELTKRGLLAGPSHSVGRLNTQSGKVEYLELPSKLTAAGGYIYGEELRSEPTNSDGVDVAQDARTKSDGWTIAAFWGSPTAISGKLYYTTLGGLTYVIDAHAKVLDESALLAVNDLGPVGKTWSANSVSFSEGVLFHRSAKRLVAIGEKTSE